MRNGIKLELGKLGIESLTQLLTLALTNADKANERLHQSLTSERPEAVVQIAERQLELAESMFSKAFDMMERAIAVQETRVEAQLLRAQNMMKMSAIEEALNAAMDDDNEEESEEQGTFYADRHWAKVTDGVNPS